MLHILLGTIFLFSQLTHGQGVNLEVSISGLQGNGRVHVQLFEEGQKFKPDRGEAIEKKIPCAGKCRVSFTGLKKGSYAVMVYHDENNNGYLDTNLVGMPQEGVGTSNNVKGIPSFKKCKFRLEETTRIEIDMVYF